MTYDVGATGTRIERLVAESTDPARADELVRLLVGLYGEALTRIAAVARDTGVLERLAADPVVSELLVVHDLHPRDTTQRVTAALEEVRPYLGSHAGGVELLGVDDDGVVRLRLEGTCHGCPSSTVTATTAIETAVRRAAPEVTRVDVEGTVAPPPVGGNLLQIQPTPGYVAARLPDLPLSGLECPVPGARP
ncbi:thioredoxin [Longispora fulva]|uniref:Fe-S cluster biogenesis protein NfuA n=1 Tax=Longispora fulva TaxID=619741 RepID=A0A8J7KVM5_9ACTN|nr:NifU family protein [Longispora fulva]MBG6135482.1 Fe-S cluster biogenesis protein NfuA [Longispora fulva]GIG56277.1 thioredoxin [Longispora fulva]